LTRASKQAKGRPKDDAIQVEWILDDAGRRDSDPEYVLQRWQVVGLRNLLDVVKVATHITVHNSHSVMRE